MWEQRKDRSGLNAVIRDYGQALDLSFTNESGAYSSVRFCSADPDDTIAGSLRLLAEFIMLDWESAEYLRNCSVAIEYRDGGAFHRELTWKPITGPITEHMSDFEFRRAHPSAKGE